MCTCIANLSICTSCVGRYLRRPKCYYMEVVVNHLMLVLETKPRFPVRPARLSHPSSPRQKYIQDQELTKAQRRMCQVTGEWVHWQTVISGQGREVKFGVKYVYTALPPQKKNGLKNKKKIRETSLGFWEMTFIHPSFIHAEDGTRATEIHCHNSFYLLF